MEKKNNTFEEIWEKLKSSKKVLMKLHDGPDGDSFGSCVTMKQILEKEGIEVTLISKDNLSENLEAFEFSKEVEFGKELKDFDLREFDVVLLLDHGALTYSSENVEKLLKNNFIINIDHHESNDYFGKMNYVDIESPSCCSVLFEFLEKIGVNFDERLCRKLLLGICTDTNFFIFVNPLDNLKKAAFLIERGKIDYEKEFFNPINASSWGLKKMQGILLSNMKKKQIDGKNVAYSFMTKKEGKNYNLNMAEKRLGILAMQGIKDVDIVFTLKELGNKIKGSFRSKGVDTVLFSKEFGGGGHKQASAFSLEKMPMEKAIEKVLEVIEKIGMHKI